MEKDLVEGIKRVAVALNKHDVEYMFVGGVAIGFYGSPRPSANLPKDVTYDVDVWYRASIDNFNKLVNAMTAISPELDQDLKKVVFDPKRTFIKFKLDKFQFDFLPELVAFHHKDFRKCYASKSIGEIEGTFVNVISKDDLLLDKEKLGRDKDLADIENLKKNSYKGFIR